MTQLATESTLDALIAILTEYPEFVGCEQKNERLAENTPYVEKNDGHNACRECGAGFKPIDLGNKVEIVCMEHSNDHVYQLDPEDVFSYQLNADAVLRDIAIELGFDEIQDEVEQTPEYAVATVSDQIRLALLLRPERHESVVNSLLSDAVRNGRLNAIFTPTDFEHLDWGTVLQKPLAGVAPLFPLDLLPDGAGEISRQLESASTALERQELVLKAGDSDTDLVRHLNQNPRATQFELEYTPLFRVAGSPDSRRIGTRFEEVCSVAFETLDFPDKTDELGTNNPGEVVPDIAFAIQNESDLPEERGSNDILGIVDAKSNAEANIGKEEIVKKHAEYLRQADVPPFSDHYDIAHIFVVLSMEGHEANEIDWYDAIEANYHGKDVNDITMVVLYADALAHMIDMHLSATQRNEANLSIGDLRDVFRPFFNYRGFKHALDQEVRTITRLDGRDLSNSGESYREEYKQRERLLVVTREMVDKHYRNRFENHNRYDRLLSGYGDSL